MTQPEHLAQGFEATPDPLRVEVVSVRKTTKPDGFVQIGHQAVLYKRRLRKRDGFPVWDFDSAVGPVRDDPERAKRDAIATGMPFDEHARRGAPALTLAEAIEGRTDRTLHWIGGTGHQWGIAHRMMRSRTHVCVVHRKPGAKRWHVVRFLGDFRARQFAALKRWAREHQLRVVHVDEETGRLPKEPGEPVVCRRNKTKGQGEA